MKVFYDTEFLEDGRTIELISIGLVREDGQEYYAVVRDADYDAVRAHDWLYENVYPHLPLNVDGRLDLRSPLVKMKWWIAEDVREFLQETPDLELWAWYAAYDHVALAQLWGPMIDLPEGIPMWTNDLRQESHRLGNPDLPDQEGGVHNALYDARHNMARARALGLLGDKPTPQAEVWDMGYASGYSNAMRRMSDEPRAPRTHNPFRTASAE